MTNKNKIDVSGILENYKLQNLRYASPARTWPIFVNRVMEGLNVVKNKFQRLMFLSIMISIQKINQKQKVVES